MKKITEITCVCCSNGCVVSVDETNGNAVSGNRCSNGKAYAIHQLTNPKRQVNASLPIANGDVDHIDVKTDRAVKLEHLDNILAELKEMHLEAPIYVSQVLIHDIAGTGANLVACRTVQRVEKMEEETVEP